MAKKAKQCSNCEFWRGSDTKRNLCSEIKVGTDVFIGGLFLMTGTQFGCNKFKEKEVKDDNADDSISTNGITD